MLWKLRSYSYLLKKASDETTKGVGINEIKVIQSTEKLDWNYAKKLIEENIEIINNCISLNAPKCVQKLGLFEVQDILNDFKVLYPVFVDSFLSIE